MKIIRHPFHASIVPQEQSAATTDALWVCVIRRDGSAEILARHDAGKKEDAACVALLELVRLERSHAAQSRQAS